MIGEITNHLWQSTVFAAAAALLAFAFRKNRAEVRYWLWLSASLKFLVPFSLLVSLGTRLWDTLPTGKIPAQIAAPAVSQTMVQITQPFPETFEYTPATHHATNWLLIVLIAVWAIGFLAIAVMRFRGWLRIRAAVRSSRSIDIQQTIPATLRVRSSATLIEPGVVGFLRPVLLLPEGILKTLTPPQLEAVLAHEKSHIRRRDNLTSAFHMLVEALFWVHPMIWWIGAKLVEERERACDESVLALGSEPQIYAEGILNVCKSYLESPLRCVSGVTGSDLKRRIRAILTGRIAGDLNFGRKVALGVASVAALVLPVLVGVIGAPSIRAQSQAQSTAAIEPEYKYEVVSVKPSGPENCVGRGLYCRPTETPDGFHGVTSLKVLIQTAFGAVTEDQIKGAPGWTNQSRGYEIDAKTDEATAEALKKLSPADRKLARQQMLQAVLAERFKLLVHRETKELPVYSLFVGKTGTKLQQSSADFRLPNGDKPPAGMSDTFAISMQGPDTYLALGIGISMDRLVEGFSGVAGRQIIDKTGLTGIYDFTIRFAVGDSQPRDALGGGADLPSASPNQESMALTALRTLGFRVESGKGPVESIVIDHVERPSGN